jgi:hypothetical protein
LITDNKRSIKITPQYIYIFEKKSVIRIERSGYTAGHICLFEEQLISLNTNMSREIKLSLVERSENNQDEVKKII